MKRRARRVKLDRAALTRGALFGLAVIAPVSIGVEVLDALEVLSRGAVVFVPALAILGAFVLAGFAAARAARGSGSDSPATHGALAGLASFTAWLSLRIVTQIVLGQRLLGKDDDPTVTVVATVATVALLSMSGGIAGGLLASRKESGA